MKTWSVVFFFFFCLNFACFIVNSMKILPVQVDTMISDPTTYYTTKFNYMVFYGLLGAAPISILGLITRQYTFASIILVVWVVGQFLPIISDFLTAFPNFISSILPPEMQVFGYLLISYNAITMFMFLMQIVSQRSVET